MKTEKEYSSVLVLSTCLKHAALYFDKVLPLWKPTNIPFGLYEDVYKEFIIESPKVLFGDKQVDLADMLHFLEFVSEQQLVAPRQVDPTAEVDIEKAATYHWNSIKNAIREAGLEKAPLFVDGNEINSDTQKVIDLGFHSSVLRLAFTDLHLPMDPTPPLTAEDAMIAIANLPLIDITRTSWEQILEFRKDRESKRKLRNLIHFFRNEYEGRDWLFVRDEFEIHMDKYESTIKEWKFETLTSTLSLLFSSKELLGTLCMTIASMLFGSPLIAKFAATTGACLEVGKISVHLVNRSYGLSKFRKNHPLSYIIEAKERLRYDLNA